jgi:adenine deaminase
MERHGLVAAARGDRTLDLAITNVNLVNVFTCEIHPVDIGIYGNRIALVVPAGSERLETAQVLDGRGKWAVPGFIDTHVHIESTMVSPPNFAAAVLPLGTTTAVIDPHEIGNVLGMDGVRYMLEASEGLPLRVLVTVPSCVPAVPGIETAGAEFGPEQVAEMLTWPRVVGIAEVMDVPGVANANPRMAGIVGAGLAADLTIQGHAPQVSGRTLNAYLAAGPQSDHEIRHPGELLEKLRLGMVPLVKRSTYANPARDLVPVLKSLPLAEIALCTDDVEPADLLAHGHMDGAVREFIAHGTDPAVAIRYATLNGARHYGLRDLGAIGPGYVADILLLSSLEDVRVSHVIVGGELLAEDGRLVRPLQDPTQGMPAANTVHLPELSTDSFALRAPIDEGEVRIRLMVLEPARTTHLETATVRVSGGQVDLDSLDDNTCLLSVIPRHGQKHPPSLALLKGLHLRAGALASTIAHDSHNLVVAGRSASDMLLAAQTLAACGGGLAAVCDGQVLGKVALPVAGLMSPLPVPDLAREVAAFKKTVMELGVQARNPALAITNVALPVTPVVRLTDLGLVDVASQEFIPLFD